MALNKFNEFDRINEVRVINTDVLTISKDKPLKDSDTIRVYHGFNDYQDAIMSIKFGFSGKEKAKRIYSYESNNNPYGLFVTLDFETAKKFTYPKSKRGITVIMELSVKVSDLEAPVWPGGSYTVQGQMSEYWKDGKDRYVNGTLKARKRASESKYPFISDSDRPELAETLMGSENQALYMGDINPNMIKNVFFGESGKHGHTPKNLDRISTKEFLNKFETHEPEKVTHSRAGKEIQTLSTKGNEYHRKKQKFFKPNDDFSMDVLSKKLKDFGYSDGSEEESLDFLNNELSYSYLWAKQLKQLGK
jgi:hypothetical protein